MDGFMIPPLFPFPLSSPATSIDSCSACVLSTQLFAFLLFSFFLDSILPYVHVISRVYVLSNPPLIINELQFNSIQSNPIQSNPSQS